MKLFFIYAVTGLLFSFALQGCSTEQVERQNLRQKKEVKNDDHPQDDQSLLETSYVDPGDNTFDTCETLPTSCQLPLEADETFMALRGTDCSKTAMKKLCDGLYTEECDRKMCNSMAQSVCKGGQAFCTFTNYCSHIPGILGRRVRRTFGRICGALYPTTD